MIYLYLGSSCKSDLGEGSTHMAAAVADPRAQFVIVLRLLCADVKLGRGSGGCGVSHDVVLSVHEAYATFMLHVAAIGQNGNLNVSSTQQYHAVHHARHQ
jgi:hypothetical protein